MLFLTLFIEGMIALSGLLAVLFLIFGLIGIFVGIGLWRGKRWARITYITIGSLALLNSVISMIINHSISTIIMNIIGMILPVLILSYLLFSKKVKAYFNRRK